MLHGRVDFDQHAVLGRRVREVLPGWRCVHQDLESGLGDATDLLSGARTGLRASPPSRAACLTILRADDERGPVAPAAADLPVLEVRSLGMVPYATALEMQRELVAARQAGEARDQLLLLEHPAVITVGVSGRSHRDHVLASSAELRDRAIEVLDVSRGGDVTYHGPGQLVGYPVIDLKPDRCDVRRYVRDLEEVLIRTAEAFGVVAGRVDGLTGVWVGDDKLAAIGVRLSRWVTSHGFALNVATDLDQFRLIVPCGLQGRGVTTLERLTAAVPPRPELEAVVTAEFARVFDRRIQHLPV